MVFAHFGGGVIGDLDTCEVFCGDPGQGRRGPVLSVDYRLAPEDRFPAGLDDMLAAYRWARDNAARFGAPAGKAAVGGDSMGGNFAAVICQEMRRRGEPQPALQLLIYPALDVASETQSMTTYADAWPLSRDTMEWFMGHYLGPETIPADPRALADEGGGPCGPGAGGDRHRRLRSAGRPGRGLRQAPRATRA